MKAEWTNRGYEGSARWYWTGRRASTDLDVSPSDLDALLPWPSLGCQQAALAGAVALGLITAFVLGSSRSTSPVAWWQDWQRC